MNEKRYTIEELQELTGYSRRTIRYYVQEGLIDPPAGRGRGGFYFDSHLKRLLHIKSLQEQGLKLSDILEYFRQGNEPVQTYQREIWIKYPLKPGIEIHINRDLEEKERKRIAEIIRVARSIFESGGREDE
ncbi:MerR family transcriptional regulator [bacterium]|nr:MerR family transcriptional regulator [bacterium]